MFVYFWGMQVFFFFQSKSCQGKEKTCFMISCRFIRTFFNEERYNLLHCTFPLIIFLKWRSPLQAEEPERDLVGLGAGQGLGTESLTWEKIFGHNTQMWACLYTQSHLQLLCIDVEVLSPTLMCGPGQKWGGLCLHSQCCLGLVPSKSSNTFFLLFFGTYTDFNR